MKIKNKEDNVSRRNFFASASIMSAILAAGPKSFSRAIDTAPTTGLGDCSKFGGVQIGAITYSWRDLPSSIEDILKYCRECGICSLELMGDAIETYAGIPSGPADLPKQLTPDQQGRLDGILKMSNLTVDQLKTNLGPAVWKMVVTGVVGTTPEQRAWRTSVPMTKFAELRKLFNDAGVEIHIAKISPADWSDGEIDYAFEVAKTLGAVGITQESDLQAARRLGPFAEKHGLYAIFHNHYQFADKTFNVDELLAASPNNMLNFDCGHYYGSTGLNPADLIKKYHHRIVSLHMKDKTGPTTNPPNENQVWGQGETPLAEILRLLKEHAQEKDWPKYVDIEIEYKIPAWSNALKETKTCRDYARQILM